MPAKPGSESVRSGGGGATAERSEPRLGEPEAKPEIAHGK